ncbi:hypothetical protein D3C80_1434900 [compost metagenome]
MKSAITLWNFNPLKKGFPAYFGFTAVFVPSARETKLATVIGVFLYSNCTTILPLVVSKVAKIPSGACVVKGVFLTAFFVAAVFFVVVVFLV